MKTVQVFQTKFTWFIYFYNHKYCFAWNEFGNSITGNFFAGEFHIYIQACYIYAVCIRRLCNRKFAYLEHEKFPPFQFSFYFFHCILLLLIFELCLLTNGTEIKSFSTHDNFVYFFIEIWHWNSHNFQIVFFLIKIKFFFINFFFFIFCHKAFVKLVYIWLNFFLIPLIF